MYDKMWDHAVKKSKKAKDTDTLDSSFADFDYGENELIFQNLKTLMLSSHYAADVKDMSAKYFDNDEQFDGAEHIFPKGYS